MERATVVECGSKAFLVDHRVNISIIQDQLFVFKKEFIHLLTVSFASVSPSNITIILLKVSKFKIVFPCAIGCVDFAFGIIYLTSPA